MDNTAIEKWTRKTTPITVIKIVLDVLMVLIFIMLMDSKIISMAFHEIAGLIIGGVFLIHKLLNWKWIKGVARNIFGPHVNAETRLRFIVDILLFIGVYLIIISGALISEYVFANSAGGGAWKTVHTVIAYLCIPLIGVHVGLHVNWIKNAFRRMLRISRESNIKWALRAASLALAVWGIVNVVTSGLFSKIAGSSESEHQYLSTGVAAADSGETTTSSGSSDSTQSSDEGSSTVSGLDDTASVSLEEYLSNLTCTACHKHCSLLSPQCGKGRQQQEQATAEYESIYEVAAADTEATVYTVDGVGYLSVGTSVYSLEASESDITAASAVSKDMQTVASDTDQTDVSLKGGGHGGEGIGGSHSSGQSTQSVWSVFLTYAPIVWLFGAVGWAATLLTGRKRKARNKSMPETD